MMNMVYVRYTKDEDDAIRQWQETGEGWEERAAADPILAGRSRASICDRNRGHLHLKTTAQMRRDRRAPRLLRYVDPRAWTEEEDSAIREEMAVGVGWLGRVAARLPTRTQAAITSHVTRLGLTIHRVKPWFPPQEKGRLRPGQASVARSRRRQAMQHHR